MFLKQPCGGIGRRNEFRVKQVALRPEIDSNLRPANKAVPIGGRKSIFNLAKSMDNIITSSHADADAATLGPKG
jgi:hypothetical protein